MKKIIVSLLVVIVLCFSVIFSQYTFLNKNNVEPSLSVNIAKLNILYFLEEEFKYFENKNYEIDKKVEEMISANYLALIGRLNEAKYLSSHEEIIVCRINYIYSKVDSKKYEIEDPSSFKLVINHAIQVIDKHDVKCRK